MFPLVLDLAADNFAVAVTCRVLGFSKQAFYQWRANPVTQRDWDDAHLINAAREIHHDDPEFGYRFITDELAGHGKGQPRPGQPVVHAGADLQQPRQEARPEPQTPTAGARRPDRAPIHRGHSEPAAADRHHRAPHRRGQALPVRGQGRLHQPDRRLLHVRADDRRRRFHGNNPRLGIGARRLRKAPTSYRRASASTKRSVDASHPANVKLTDGAQGSSGMSTKSRCAFMLASGPFVEVSLFWPRLFRVWSR